MIYVLGSRCYSIYTYKGSDWEKKTKSFFEQKCLRNKYVLHGLTHEKHALAAYKYSNNCDVLTPGLIISHLYPWLAYSPDGIRFENGKPKTLIEIKCPYIGGYIYFVTHELLKVQCLSIFLFFQAKKNRP